MQEFVKTDSGKLSKRTFETINLDSSANPPCFGVLPTKVRTAEEEAAKPSSTEQGQEEIELNLTHDNKGAVDDDFMDVDGDVSVNDELYKETEGLIVSNQEYGQAMLTAEDTLSDLDEDPEVLNSIAMSDDETDFKRELWMAENYDWVAKQEGILIVHGGF